MEDLLKMHTLPKLHNREKHEDDGCMMAQAYICPQPLEGVFPPEEGLCKGTAFPNLSQPYMGWHRNNPCGSEVSI